MMLLSEVLAIACYNFLEIDVETDQFSKVNFAPVLGYQVSN